MVLRMNGTPKIEDLREHPAELVEKLSALLVAGARATPDPRRKNFYELENCSRVFYIHISPYNGKVYLLGTWEKEVAAGGWDVLARRRCTDLVA